jgi:cyanophycin synthetase
MNLQQAHDNVLTDKLRFTIQIKVPTELSLKSYHFWANYLINRPKWDQYDLHKMFDGELDLKARVFIDSHLCLWKTFFDLGRLPIFDQIRVKSIVLKNTTQNIYTLDIEFLKLDFISLNAYQIPIGISLKITHWMTQNDFSEGNLQQLNKTINDDVIQPMQRFSPGGQSTIPVLKSAHQLGITYMHLGQGVYQLGWGSRAIRLDRSSNHMDAMIGAKLSQNKVSSANILRMSGLPCPLHGIVYGEKDAIKTAKEIGFPIVVKPADQDRGEGVTVGIEDEYTLRKAFGIAQRLSKSKEVIVERHVPGVCHRFFVVGQKLLYVVKRRPMGVFGNGVDTISKLIEQELNQQNKKPLWNRSKLKPLDELAIQTLEQEGLKPTSIPGLGAFVALRPIESTEWGGVDEDMTVHVHPDNIDVAVRAAQLMNLHIAGVDIISSDIRQPWHQNGAIINEVNYAPLLGGAEISRSYLPQFFNLLFDEKRGQIPLEIFNDIDLARQRWQSHCQQDLRAYFVSQAGIEDPWGRPVIMPLTDVRQRIKALTCRSDVDAIVALI